MTEELRRFFTAPLQLEGVEERSVR